MSRISDAAQQPQVGNRLHAGILRALRRVRALLWKRALLVTGALGVGVGVRSTAAVEWLTRGRGWCESRRGLVVVRQEPRPRVKDAAAQNVVRVRVQASAWRGGGAQQRRLGCGWAAVGLRLAGAFCVGASRCRSVCVEAWWGVAAQSTQRSRLSSGGSPRRVQMCLTLWQHEQPRVTERSAGVFCDMSSGGSPRGVEMRLTRVVT